MRRWLPLFLLSLAALATVAAAVGVAGAAPGSREGGGKGVGRGFFAVGCGFSHRNTDDLIVFPGRAGLSHDHTYFGNTTTKATSTPATLRASQSTTCRRRGDTAAYWIPTLLSAGRAVEPLGATVYYIRRTFEPVQAFPQGLQMIAGTATATSPQSQDVTSWRCRFERRAARSSTIPTCTVGTLLLRVDFPNCWNGTSLDSADHKSHMAYSAHGVCPASHPVEMPAISLRVHYRPVEGATASLSSGGQFSGHGDFVNAWDQQRLERLVDRYLNRNRRR